MTHFKINTPIWSRKAVGLDPEKIEENNTVEITKKGKDGELLYPGIFPISGSMAERFRVESFGKGVPVRVIPIELLRKGKE